MSNQGENRTRRLSSYLDIFRDARVAWKLFWDRRVPIVAKAIPFLSLAYILMPIDLLPDFALGLGQLDDLAILLLGLKLFVEVATPSVTASASQPHRDATQDRLWEDRDTIDSSYHFLDGDSVHRGRAPIKRE